jgi:hypothetical protein
MFVKTFASIFIMFFCFTQEAFAISTVNKEKEDVKEEGEKKAKPDEKPRPDSAISVILGLPEVKKWKEAIESKKDGSTIDIWGESIKEVNGSKCWGVAAAERNGDDSRIWKRFCIMQTGLEIWIEQVSRDDGIETIKYLTYEKWRKSCNSSQKSNGSC